MDEANLSDVRAALKFRGVKVKGEKGGCLWIQELVMDGANLSDARAALKFRGVKVKGRGGGGLPLDPGTGYGRGQSLRR